LLAQFVKDSGLFRPCAALIISSISNRQHFKKRCFLNFEMAWNVKMCYFFRLGHIPPYYGSTNRQNC